MKLINPEKFCENTFELFAKKWCLIAAADKTGPDAKCNAMTASWGGTGVLWGKNVFFCFVRPQRYTKEFIDKSDYISLSFFGEEYRDALSYCGSHSGRDGDKIAKCGLSPVISDSGAVEFKEAKITIYGKKLFASEMKKGDFIERSIIEKHYPKGDFHTVYVCEIESIKEY